jgi:hypothetical protein
MNRTYLISSDNLKTIAQGALGAMTFGAYHQFVTNRMMELNNENIRLQQKTLELQRRAEMKVLEEKITKLQQQRRWF